jgi:hypothetical protein
MRCLWDRKRASRDALSHNGAGGRRAYHLPLCRPPADQVAGLRLVLGHSRRLTLVGIALGVAGAFGVSRLMEQVLFEVDPADPLIYIAVSATLLLVAEFASWLPARRATRIDPVVALRME